MPFIPKNAKLNLPETGKHDVCRANWPDYGGLHRRYALEIIRLRESHFSYVADILSSEEIHHETQSFQMFVWGEFENFFGLYR